jgi:NADPH:quinone reductase-like Zn-dependent oxidoreductase
VREGACAEYVCVPENKLVRKPVSVSFEEAAAIPVAALTALQGLRDQGRIQRGHQVVIDGASGGVGTYAIQIAPPTRIIRSSITGVRWVRTAPSSWPEAVGLK